MYTKQFLSLLIAAAIAIGAILSAQGAINTSNVVSDSSRNLWTHKNWTADAARWKAMGEYYQDRAEAENITRSRTADTARWVAMSRYHQQSGRDASLNQQRQRAADTTRWMAMAEYDQNPVKVAAETMASARTADTSRWTEMGKYYIQFTQRSD